MTAVMTDVRELLERALLPLAAIGTDLHRCAVGYVLDGTDPDLPDALAEFGPRPDWLLAPVTDGGLPSRSWDDDETERLWARGIEILPGTGAAPVLALRDPLYRSGGVSTLQWMRLGRLLDAAHRTSDASRAEQNDARLPDWFRALIMDVTGTSDLGFSHRRRDGHLLRERPRWDAQRLDDLLAVEGMIGPATTEVIFRLAFRPRFPRKRAHLRPVHLPGVSARLAEQDTGPLQELEQWWQRRALLEWLAAEPDSVGRRLPALAALALDDVEELRQRAVAVLRGMEGMEGRGARARHDGVLAAALRGARADCAAELVAFLVDTGHGALLRDTATANPAIAGLVNRAQALQSVLDAAPVPQSVDPPPLLPMRPRGTAAPVAEELRAALNASPGTDGRPRRRRAGRVGATDLDALVAAADGSGVYPPLLDSYDLADIASSAPSLTFAHALRLAALTDETSYWALMEHYAGPECDPRAVLALAAELGLDVVEVAERIGPYVFDQVSPECSWPWYAERPERLRVYLDDPGSAVRALEILGALPHVPAELLPVVARMAVDGSQSLRLPAQGLLTGHPAAPGLAEMAMSSTRPGVRALGAVWLGKIAGAGAEPVLRAALAEEQDPMVRAALLTALRAGEGDPVGGLIPGEAAADPAAQTTGLYEAMCTGRTWTPEQWRELQLGNPLVGRLATRLIWMATGADDGSCTFFRPAQDGALLRANGAAAELHDGAVVLLAHRTRMSGREAVAWRMHLLDSGVEPLFDQLSATAPALVEGQTAVEDLAGHVTDSASYGWAAAQRGYSRTRGGRDDRYDRHVKEISSADLTAVLTFTGAPVREEESVPCATRALFFERDGGAVPLTEVPTALLAECYADYAALAALGDFDPSWRDLDIADGGFGGATDGPEGAGTRAGAQ